MDARSRVRPVRRPRLPASARMVFDAVPKEGEQDEHGVLAAWREPVRHLVPVRATLDESLLLHLPQASREDAGREPRVVPEELPEPIELQEGHVPQDEQRPFPAEDLNALPDRVSLVREERDDRTVRSFAFL